MDLFGPMVAILLAQVKEEKEGGWAEQSGMIPVYPVATDIHSH